MNVGISGFKSYGPDGFNFDLWLREVAVGLRFLLLSDYLLQRVSESPSRTTGLKSLQDCKTTLLLVQIDYAASASRVT